MNTQTYFGTLVVIDCCDCGMTFGMPQEFNRNRLDDGKSFYCPRGHKQFYTETTTQKLRKQLESEKQQREWADSRARAARDQADAAERRRRAAKGALTKMKKKVAAGVCPSCEQQFPDVGAHMQEQHPDFVDEP